MMFSRKGVISYQSASGPVESASSESANAKSAAAGPASTLSEPSKSIHNQPNCQIAWLNVLTTLVAGKKYIDSGNDWNIPDDILQHVIKADPTLWQYAEKTIDTMMTNGLLKVMVSDDVSSVKHFLSDNKWNLDISKMPTTPNTFYVMVKTVLDMTWKELTNGYFSYKNEHDKKILQIEFKPDSLVSFKTDTYNNTVAMCRFQYRNLRVSIRFTYLKDCKEPFHELVKEHLTKDSIWTDEKRYTGFNVPAFRVNLTSIAMNPVLEATIDDRVVSAIACDGIFEINHQRIYTEMKSIATIQYRGGSTPLPDDKYLKMYSFDGKTLQTSIFVEMFINNCPVVAIIVDGSNLI